MSIHRHTRFMLVAGALAALFMPLGAQAQAYPTKVVRVISTFGAGSPADALIRAISQKMSEAMGQPFVVEAQPGASGVVGATMVARAAPDGYTLLVTIPTTVVATPYLLKVKPYDALKDFTPITAALDAATCLMVSTSLPVKSMQELIAYVKKNPGKVAYGSNGIGGTYHMEMEAIRLKNGLEMTHVPYKGGTAALQAAANGEVPIAFSPLSSALPFMKSGKVRVLAIMDDRRYPGNPDIPSMGEQVPGYEKTPTGSYYYGPAGMQRPVVMRLYEEIDKALKQPDVVERMRAIAFFSTVNTPDEFVELTKKQIEIAQRAIKIAKIPVEQ